MKKTNTEWAIKATLIGFLITLFFTALSEIILTNLNLFIAIVVLIFFIMIGVIFDMVGIAVTAATERSFNSMASNKVTGSFMAVRIIKNAAQVTSFLNDIVGDICNIISGTIGVVVALVLHVQFNLNLFAATLLVTSTIAAITIGGKAFGKSIALKNANFILLRFAQIVSIFTKK